MRSYRLIRNEDILDLQANDNCALRVVGGDGDEDGEPAFQKLHSINSPRSANALSRRTPPSPTRLATLDIFRGLTVALMILVDDAGGILPTINHSPWNGLTLADFVMPFFLLMVGMSLALVYKNMSCRFAASKKAICRAVKLLILGVFLQGGYFHGLNNLTYGVDMEQIRWMGILQRIAAAYLLAALCEIWLRNDEKVSSGLSLLQKYQFHWVVMLMIISLYILLLYGLYVPDWEYQILNEAFSEAKIFRVQCNVRGDTGPACNAAGMIDRTILGVQHLYQKPIYARTKQCSINSPDYGPIPPDAPSWCRAPFEPEGILSTMMAIVTSLVGLQYGHTFVHFKDHKDRLLLWLIPSSGCIVLGLLCDICGMHINKALFSFSYMCVTTGAAGILFAAIYLVVDVYGCRRFTMVLEWMGMHALLLYVLVACNILPLILQGFYWRQPRNNIFTLIGIGTKT